MKYKKVILRISGGIGNQLFQYGYAFAAARKSGDKTKIIILSHYQNHFWSRGAKYSAARNLKVHELLPEKKSTFISDSKEWILLDFFLKFRAFRNKKLQKLYGFISGSLILDGYFQSPIEFELTSLVLDEMRNLYKSSLPLTELVKVRDDRCVIHVRAGDLLSQPWNQLCNANYYNHAINYIKDNFGICSFDVITEDYKFAKKLLSEINEVKLNFLKTCDEVTDFNRIASYKYIICANSTFSWWAAILGQPKSFCSPEYFYKLGDKPSKFKNEYCVKY